MRTFVRLSSLALGTVLVAGPALSESRPSDSLETAFVASGRITIMLSAGGYQIKESPDNRIRLHWSVRDQGQLAGVEARAEVDGSEAKIVLDGPTNHFQATIEVPTRSDLFVRLSAGELSIEDIVGDKDIRLRAGELRIEVGSLQDYSHVEASVWAGELSAAPFQVAKGGLFRSFEWKGDGKHKLRARLRAGELRLY